MQFKGSSAVLCLILFFIGGSNGLNCATSTLPVVPNSSNTASSATTVSPGTMVTFTCDTNYRIAPADDPAILSMTQTVMCEANGAFDPSSFSCVPMNPSSCEDFYSRAKMFTDLVDDECVTVTIDPNGPSVAPAAITGTMCCKRSDTEIETMIEVSAATMGQTAHPGPCTTGGLFTNVMPSTNFIPAISKFCDGVEVVYKVASHADVQAIIETTSGGCSQEVTVTCATAVDMAPAIRYNTEASGILYGTNEFPDRGADINLDHYTYTSGGCGAAACQCPGTDDTDTIARTDISAANPAFVTYFGATQHNEANTPAGTYTISVQPIKCTQAFP